MNIKNKPIGVMATLCLAAGIAISAQDRFSLKVPNGLAFAEFTRIVR
jgi:hypothetical protein